MMLAGLSGCAQEQNKEGAQVMSGKKDRVVRVAVGAGRWFPSDRNELLQMVSGYIDGADGAAGKGPIVAAISPHAGFMYSGKVAGFTFRAIRDAAERGDRPETVVIAGFSHSASFRGVALMDGDVLSTPLGEVPIDAEANRVLEESSDLIKEDYRPHYGEHSAENQVPFVQAALPEAKIVVALMGDHDLRTVEQFADALVRLAKKKRILLVASTDLLHDPDYDKVTAADRNTLGLITALKTKELVGSWSGTNQVCCGIMPVVTAMHLAQEQGCSKGTLLHYRNSGDDFPESRGEWVVGYGSVVFHLPN